MHQVLEAWLKANTHTIVATCTGVLQVCRWCTYDLQSDPRFALKLTFPPHHLPLAQASDLKGHMGRNCPRALKYSTYSTPTFDLWSGPTKAASRLPGRPVAAFSLRVR